MRGDEPSQVSMTVYVSMEQMVEHVLAKDHPLRPIKKFMDDVLKAMSPEFDQMYAAGGRPSVAPELLLRSMIWQALFSVRSEVQLVERIQFDMLARWFVGLPLDHNVWDHSVYSANRKIFRLQAISEGFFLRHVEFLRERGLLS